MSSEILSAWINILVLCLFGMLLPSIRLASWRIAVSDAAFPIIFPVRALFSKIVCKPKWLKSYTDVRIKGKVNYTGIFWYIFALAGVVIMALDSFLRFFSERELGLFVNVLIYALVLLMLLTVIGLFTADNKSRQKIRIEDVEPEDIHLIEQEIAFGVGERIAEDQSRVAPLGYQWRIDVFCTDKLEDKTNKTFGSTMAAITGAPPSNPVYMSRIVVTLLEGEEPVKIPAGRKADIDISFTQNRFLILLGIKRVVDACAEEVSDITRMILYRRGLPY